MVDKQIIDKLKNDVACKENIINHLAEHSIKLQAQLKCKEQECKKLIQALTEIKGIAEEVYNDCDNCYRDTDTNCEVDCIDCTLGGKAKLAEQILQLISEVEDDRKD